MTKRQIYLLSTMAILFVSALAYDLYTSRDLKIDDYATQINEHLRLMEQEVADVFENKSFFERQLSSANASFTDEDNAYLESLNSKPYTLLLHQKDSLILWSNSQVLLPSDTIMHKAPERQSRLLLLSNGYYEHLWQTMRSRDLGEYTLSALIPIKYQYNIQSGYLENSFAADPHIPEMLKVEAEADGPVINDFQGIPLAYLSHDTKVVDLNRLKISLILYLLAFLILGVFLNGLAQSMVQQGKPWQGAAFLIITFFGLRLLSLMFDFSGHFADLPLFTKNFGTGLSSSLGDLLINIILLLWIMAFFHKEFPVHSYSHLSFPTKVGVTVLNYVAILSAILILTWVFKNLVFNTGLTFDFDNVFSLDGHSLLAILGVILLLIALFLFSHRMMMTISRIGLSINQRLGGLALATVITLPVLLSVDFIIDSVYLLLIAFVFILIFDQFIDRRQVNFTWLLIWLVILSAFPSILLFRYNAFKDQTIRHAYAKDLAETKDQYAENALYDIYQRIQRDPKLQKALLSPNDLNHNKISTVIDDIYTEDSYLFYNYQYQFSAYNARKASLFQEQTKDWDTFEFQYGDASSQTRYENIRYWNNQKGRASYLVQMDFPVQDSSQQLNTLVLEFQRQRREQSKVFTELLVDKPYKNLTKLAKYDYAVYKDNVQIDARGNVYGNRLNTDDLPPSGEFKELMFSNRSELIYNASNNTVVIIGKETEEYLKKAISLFSFIFTMLIGFVVLFAVINYFVKILPDSLNFFYPPKPSLKVRVQYSVIALIVVSFIFIGFVTVWFFRTSSHEYHENRLERKTSSVKTDAQHELSLLASQMDSLNSDDLVQKIDLQALDIVDPLSKVHRMDVNLFDLAGNLVTSSENDIFEKGIISNKMAAPALLSINRQGRPEYVQESARIGNLTYKAAYIPLKVRETTIGYLGLPYYSRQSKLRSDVTVFMSTLMNVYVFLLLIAGAFAIFVAESITRPIAAIGDKLKQLKLGKDNEPLQWQNSQDEIGTLIAEYNRMIAKLAESAQRLAQSEREGAWREMAKQVAHEIKNPLTPMKLSIQYLQHAFRSNSQDIEPLLKRVSSTLIEQIDNLAQIASEFSNFAKMPRAENQKINLNALVTSVYDLFSDGEKMDISLHLPVEELNVYADKSHMMRVLTNLVKNAQQAIPDDREGKIEISLFHDHEKATIKVKDNGSGIPDDKRDKVFVPNFTTKSSGTGLGLAISRNIIESINGDIYFKTQVGVGTEFFVELPIVKVDELEEVEH